jgi:hypothetical protein
MTRTQIYLPDDIHSLVKTTAQKNNISMAAFIRDCVSSRCNHMRLERKGKVTSRKGNPAVKALLRIAGKVKGGPRDLATNHDYYLYEQGDD